MRIAQFGGSVLGRIDRGRRVYDAPTLLSMDMDAALIVVSFAAFVVLCVSWILAPLRAAVPAAPPVVDASAPPAALAA